MSIFGMSKAHWERIKESEDAHFWQDVFLRSLDHSGHAATAAEEANRALKAKREALK